MLIMIFPPFHDYHLLSRLIMIFPPFHDYHHDLLPRHYIMIFSPLHNHHHDLLPRLIMIFSPLHNHQQRSSPQAFLLQSISNPTKLIPMGDPEDPTGILYTKKYQCFEMFWNVLKCFEMHWNALKWWSRNQPVPFLLLLRVPLTTDPDSQRTIMADEHKKQTKRMHELEV